MAEIVSSKMFAYHAGERDFRAGLPSPKCDMSDEAWEGQLDELQVRWLGWMMARARVLTRQDKVRGWAEDGDPL